MRVRKWNPRLRATTSIVCVVPESAQASLMPSLRSPRHLSIRPRFRAAVSQSVLDSVPGSLNPSLNPPVNPSK